MPLLSHSTMGNGNISAPGEEHGGAKWGSAGVLDRKYRDRKHPDSNVILTKHVQMGLDGRVHQRNLLQIVVGGSGAGKSRGVIAPNIMLANTSYIATDPKGEILRATAPLLLKHGYIVRVFDLIDPVHSDAYNPFHYIRKDADVFRLVDNFIKNTTPKNATQSDPFWGEKQNRRWTARSMLYLLHEAPKEEQTMDMCSPCSTTLTCMTTMRSTNRRSTCFSRRCGRKIRIISL